MDTCSPGKRDLLQRQRYVVEISHYTARCVPHPRHLVILSTFFQNRLLCLSGCCALSLVSIQRSFPSPIIRNRVVKELSAEAMQMLSTALNIHLGFWSWVTSDDAAEGSWLNTHGELCSKVPHYCLESNDNEDNGRILSFDLPCFEFYTAGCHTKGVLRQGRLKHLSSQHRLYGPLPYTQATECGVYINRRVSVYLVPNNGCHTFVYFSEDCRAVSSIPLRDHPRTDPISTEWFIGTLKETPPEIFLAYQKEPVGIILNILRRLMKYCTFPLVKYISLLIRSSLKHTDPGMC
jgi:hypothetical protein